MAMKSYRIHKAAKKLKDRTKKMQAVLSAGIVEERKAAVELMKD